MKKKISTLLLLLSVSIAGQAQDFQPGQEAQNLTEQKNVTVDYATGLFHYSVPLYTLRSGTYELPVSLDYIGKGVKGSDLPGLVGYNWALNTGGVVTRVMRGGFPDEGSYGYLNPQRDAPPLHQDAKNVSLRKRDGESDLFTAVFGGKKVDFILGKNEQGLFYAEPLEQTNAKIECNQEKGGITGWTITDDNGDQYIYQQKELHTEVQHVDVSTSNAIEGNSYTSAWHLSRIVPCNGTPIVFYYLDDVLSSNLSTKEVNIQEVYDSYSMTYFYGRPIKEQSFDFERYNTDFKFFIEEARHYLQLSSRNDLQMQVDTELELFAKYGYTVSQPLESKYVKTNNRILGILANLSLMENASYELEKALKIFARDLKLPPYGSHNEEMAASNLESAAKVIRRCLSELKDVEEKDIHGGSRYSIVSPLLYLIMTPDRIVKFTYEGYDNQYTLSNVSLCHRGLTAISSVAITGKEFSFLDNAGKKYANLKFEYYGASDFPSLPEGITSDEWGYTCARHQTEAQYNIVASYRSLKKITQSDGGSIHISYEKNRVGANNKYGGIRLKSLVFDANTGKKDTISYDYSQSGVSLYRQWIPMRQVNYVGFNDQILYDRVQLTGHPIVNMGNNGLYYTNVIETLNGKGKNIYRYIAKPTSSNDSGTFWLNGLLSEKTVYDAEGKLIQSTRYTYKELSPYSRVLPQLTPSAFYLDEKSLRSFYAQQTTQYINGILLYQENIEPRLSPRGVDEPYYLKFGGMTVLSEQTEYRQGKDRPYCQIKYYYDNPESVYPTRIVRMGADNIAHTEICKRIVDMAEKADVTIDRMRERNILSPIVKNLFLTDGKLVKERVWVYKDDGLSQAGSIVPVEEWLYAPLSSESYSPVNKETQLFTYGKEKYCQINSYHYQRIPTANMLIGKSGRMEKKSVAYDYYGKVILECDAFGAIADDPYKGDSPSGISYPYDFVNAVRGIPLRYHNEYIPILEHIKQNVTDRQFLSFLDSREVYIINLFMEELSKEEAMNISLLYEYYDYISYNGYSALNRFKQEFQRLFGLYPKYGQLRYLIEFLDKVIRYDKEMLFLYFYFESYPLPFPAQEGATITYVPTSEKEKIKIYKLDSYSDSETVKVTHDGGTVTIPLKPIINSRLKVYEIDLSPYKNVSSVQTGTFEFYEAFVPDGATFQATSYNTDGTVYCRFDQTGNAEFYTYDDAGRVIRVEDQYGKVVREYEYNQLINE